MAYSEYLRIHNKTVRYLNQKIPPLLMLIINTC